MIDPLSLKAIDEAAKAGQGILSRLIGPTIDLMGEELADKYTQWRNIKRVAQLAEQKAPSHEIGSIPPRVAIEVLDKAQWADNEFLTEYLSGVLASARTPEGDSDSAIPWNALVGRLSSDQLALHWIAASTFQRRMRGTSQDAFWNVLKSQIVMEYGEAYLALDWKGLFPNRLLDAAYGLERENLITNLSHGQGSYLQDDVAYTKGHKFDPQQFYITFQLTSDAIRLLQRAAGARDLWVGMAFYDSAIERTELIKTLPTKESIRIVADFPQVQP